jgi:hypothetical protein
MSEELRRYVEEAIYKWVKKQIDAGNFKANLRIEIDNPIEIRGMKGRVVGDIIISEQTPERVPESLPSYTVEPKKDGSKKEGNDQAQEDMSLAEVDRLLKSLGV